MKGLLFSIYSDNTINYSPLERGRGVSFFISFFYFRLMPRAIIPYHPKLKELARQLRNNSTLSGVLLWNCLKGKQMRCYDFHRQQPLLNFIVDFFCHELMLAIEIDGDSHDHKFEQDVQRQKTLEEIGIRFIR